MKPLIIVTCFAALGYIGWSVYSDAAGPTRMELETRVYQCRQQMITLSEAEQQRCWNVLEQYREVVAGTSGL